MNRSSVVCLILVGIDLEKPLVADPEVVRQLVGDRVRHDPLDPLLVDGALAFDRVPAKG